MLWWWWTSNNLMTGFNKKLLIESRFFIGSLFNIIYFSSKLLIFNAKWDLSEIPEFYFSLNCQVSVTAIQSTKITDENWYAGIKEWSNFKSKFPQNSNIVR